jgi:uncharacterized protein YjbJ (UPF0337 family)
MNGDEMKDNWKQFVGKAKEKWGRLTNDAWQVVEDKCHRLVGKIQERYGITRDETERQLGEFEKSHERAGLSIHTRPNRV